MKKDADNKKYSSAFFIFILLALGIAFAFAMKNSSLGMQTFKSSENLNLENNTEKNSTSTLSSTSIETKVEEKKVIASHIKAPSNMRGIYITGWSAGTAKSMVRIMKKIEEANINTVVIDIKDATGMLSYMPLEEKLLATGVGQNRIPDLQSLINKFHEKGIYVIGRVAVFQDPFFAKTHPEETYKNKKTGKTWEDRKGIAWVRADSLPMMNYISEIAHDAYNQGFDEINADYVRFPSDGDLENLDKSTIAKSLPLTIQDLFINLDKNIRQDGIPLSADIFGLTLSVNDGMGIGQELDLIAPYVDYVCPMIYPSHFGDGVYGYDKPAKYPYEIIYKSLSDGLAKLTATGTNKMSLEDAKLKLRPWLQDFNLEGVNYTKAMVDAQIKAVSDLGINSWLMWDPRNYYTEM